MPNHRVAADDRILQVQVRLEGCDAGAVVTAVERVGIGQIAGDGGVDEVDQALRCEYPAAVSPREIARDGAIRQVDGPGASRYIGPPPTTALSVTCASCGSSSTSAPSWGRVLREPVAP